MNNKNNRPLPFSCHLYTFMNGSTYSGQYNSNIPQRNIIDVNNNVNNIYEEIQENNIYEEIQESNNNTNDWVKNDKKPEMYHIEGRQQNMSHYPKEDNIGNVGFQRGMKQLLECIPSEKNNNKMGGYSGYTIKQEKDRVYTICDKEDRSFITIDMNKNTITMGTQYYDGNNKMSKKPLYKCSIKDINSKKYLPISRSEWEKINKCKSAIDLVARAAGVDLPAQNTARRY